MATMFSFRGENGLEAQVQESFLEGGFERAQKTIDGFLKQDSSYGPLFLLKGMYLQGAGRFEEAVEAYEESLKPENDSDGWLRPVLSSAIRMRIWSHRPVAQNYMGMALTKLGRYEEAKKIFEGLLEKVDPYAHNNLAFTYIKMNCYEEAEQHALKALDVDPKNPVFHDTLAWVHMGKGRVDLAILEFQNALRLDPNSDIAHYGLGYALLKSSSGPLEGDLKEHYIREAEMHFRKVLEVVRDVKPLVRGYSSYHLAANAEEMLARLGGNRVRHYTNQGVEKGILSERDLEKIREKTDLCFAA